MAPLLLLCAARIIWREDSSSHSWVPPAGRHLTCGTLYMASWAQQGSFLFSRPLPFSFPVSDGKGGAHLCAISVLRLTQALLSPNCSSEILLLSHPHSKWSFIRPWLVGSVWAGIQVKWLTATSLQRPRCLQAISHSHFLSTYFHTGWHSLQRLSPHCN